MTLVKQGEGKGRGVEVKGGEEREGEGKRRESKVRQGKGRKGKEIDNEGQLKKSQIVT